MDSLKEMVLDEGRLVTYLTLSKDLCLHVNECKQLLNQFIENTKKNQCKITLNVNYIICGVLSNNAAKTSVCTELEIDNVRRLYTKIFYEHIYSVSKGAPLVDSVAILAVNKLEDFTLYNGLIKSSHCSKFSSDEVLKLKFNSQTELTDTKIALEQKKTSVSTLKHKSAPENFKTVSKNKIEIAKVKSEPTIKTEHISPKKDKEIAVIQTSNNKSKIKKSQKGISTFFSKSNSNPEKSKIPNNDLLKKDNVAKTSQLAIDSKPKIKEEDVLERKLATNKLEDDQMSSNVEIMSLDIMKKTGKVDKKRKRVIEVSDSDSDDDKNNSYLELPEDKCESEDEIPPTPAVNTIKITTGITNPKKKRKTVDKTFTDEEGYILTKKVEIYESCSDNEDTKPLEHEELKENVNKNIKPKLSPKKPKITNSKKKQSPPQKGKQSTLTNFFKKL